MLRVFVQSRVTGTTPLRLIYFIASKIHTFPTCKLYLRTAHFRDQRQWSLNMTISLPQLPLELWLKIFEDVANIDLWLSVREVDQTFRKCIDDIAKTRMICRSAISTIISLAAGSQHRWYDIRGTVHFAFKELSQQNAQYAEFEIAALRPDVYAHSVAEKWNRICAKGIDQDLIWNITMANSHGVATAVGMPLPNCVIIQEHGLRCDWRLMLRSYFTQSRRANMREEPSSTASQE
jgi:hypothetical protein